MNKENLGDIISIRSQFLTVIKTNVWKDVMRTDVKSLRFSFLSSVIGSKCSCKIIQKKKANFKFFSRSDAKPNPVVNFPSLTTVARLVIRVFIGSIAWFNPGVQCGICFPGPSHWQRVL